jgi:hypothetical protein
MNKIYKKNKGFYLAPGIDRRTVSRGMTTPDRMP